MEDPIDRAMREGKFDDLPGKGKRLHLSENPHEDPEWGLAFHMLKENGFTLPWIQLRQEIESEIESARLALRRAWQTNQDGTGAHSGDVDWRRARSHFHEQVEQINRRIRDYNLQTPSLNFQLPPLNAEREIDRLTAI